MCLPAPKPKISQVQNPLLQAPPEQGAADLTHLLIGANRPGASKPQGLDALEINLGAPLIGLSGLSINKGY